MNPKASEVATELRNLADRIEKLGDAEVSRPFVYFSHSSYGDNKKERFVALAKVLPRPLKKTYVEGLYPDLTLEHNTDIIHITAAIPRSEVCEILEPARPAKYHCPSIFTTDEEAALGEF
jgi:hypothetical protein